MLFSNHPPISGGGVIKVLAAIVRAKIVILAFLWRRMNFYPYQTVSSSLSGFSVRKQEILQNTSLRESIHILGITAGLRRNISIPQNTISQ